MWNIILDFDGRFWCTDATTNSLAGVSGQRQAAILVANHFFLSGAPIDLPFVIALDCLMIGNKCPYPSDLGWFSWWFCCLPCITPLADKQITNSFSVKCIS